MVVTTYAVVSVGAICLAASVGSRACAAWRDRQDANTPPDGYSTMTLIEALGPPATAAVMYRPL